MRVLVDVLGGLHGLHSLRDAINAPLGAFHGALCPANVVIGKDGVARVVGALGARPVRLAPGSESLGYAAPEVLDAGAVQDARADVYAAGVILWEALMGRRVGEEKDPALIAQRQREEELPRPAIPLASPFARLADVAMRALAFDPALRFRSASEMATELRRVAGTRLAPGSVVAQRVVELAGDRIRARRAELDPSPRRRSEAPRDGVRYPSAAPAPPVAEDVAALERTASSPAVEEAEPVSLPSEAVILAETPRVSQPPPVPRKPAPRPAAPRPAGPRPPVAAQGTGSTPEGSRPELDDLPGPRTSLHDPEDEGAPSGPSPSDPGVALAAAREIAISPLATMAAAPADVEAPSEPEATTGMETAPLEPEPAAQAVIDDEPTSAEPAAREAPPSSDELSQAPREDSARALSPATPGELVVPLGLGGRGGKSRLVPLVLAGAVAATVALAIFAISRSGSTPAEASPAPLSTSTPEPAVTAEPSSPQPEPTAPVPTEDTSTPPAAPTEDPASARTPPSAPTEGAATSRMPAPDGRTAPAVPPRRAPVKKKPYEPTGI